MTVQPVEAARDWTSSGQTVVSPPTPSTAAAGEKIDVSSVSHSSDGGDGVESSPLAAVDPSKVDGGWLASNGTGLAWR